MAHQCASADRLKILGFNKANFILGASKRRMECIFEWDGKQQKFRENIRRKTGDIFGYQKTGRSRRTSREARCGCHALTSALAWFYNEEEIERGYSFLKLFLLRLNDKNIYVLKIKSELLLTLKFLIKCH